MNDEIKCVKLKPIYFRTMAVILDYRKHHDMNPSYKELRDLLGLYSTSPVHNRLSTLAHLGAIEMPNGSSRGIAITCDMIELDVDWHKVG